MYVKAGSIIPFGPRVQYATEKKWGDLDIRVYPGADADFTLYEDENDNYNYEKGKYTEIKFHWDDKKHMLKIADRTGSFDGMLKDRKFTVSITTAGGERAAELKLVKSVSYTGKETSVSF